MKKIALVSFVLFSSFIHAGTFICKEAKAINGNTFSCVTDQGTHHTVHLYKITTPKIGQPHGDEAMHALDSLVQKGVRVEAHEGYMRGRSYENIYGEAHRDCNVPAYIRNLAGACASEISTRMVAEGYAEIGSSYINEHREFATFMTIEQAAKNAKRGIWADN